MKPFDLQAAMRGEKVVTRDGREFKFGAYGSDVNSGQSLIGWVEGVAMVYWSDGAWSKLGESRDDLFMAPKKIKLWRRTFRSRFGEYMTVTKRDGQVVLLDYDDGSTWVTAWEEFEVEE